MPHRAIAGPSPPARFSRCVAKESGGGAGDGAHQDEAVGRAPRFSVGKSSLSSVPTASPPHAASTITIVGAIHRTSPPLRKNAIWNTDTSQTADDRDRPPATRLGEPAREQDADEAGRAHGDGSEDRDVGVGEAV